ncbi:RNA polymerase sigma factor [Pedobacter psychroterrae]|uniref:Sigma-70 family RNA polymerase sigma factor n=1 Tax=Pedobacter psychroterrae TaxID=2530453 RepID=A0A4R0NK60_9SPHI|nr:sigma-70 family RNA polymerase sigma factor [Pedobacter psychroterrae]TCD00228.1 sigma-70 family RNA polymerase sigma factor [Pedobacter psychroterrae]
MNLFPKSLTKLIDECKSNDRKAQESLYKHFYAEMLSLCFRYLRTDELAKEALNIGFLKVFQNITAFEEIKGELGAWIRTIMVRTCIDLVRKELNFNIQPISAQEEEIFIEPTVLSKLYAEDLIKSIRKLPDATQLVFNLSVLDGYSHKEIGGKLNISESTSRWHLSEAKKQLRILLTPPNKQIDLPTENNNKTT